VGSSYSWSIGADGLTATLTLADRKPPPTEEQTAVLDAIDELAVAAGIVAPLARDALTAAVRAWRKDGRRREVVAARGRAPVPGADAKLTLFPPKRQEAAAQGRVVGRVDRRNLGFVHNMTEGTVLATATHPTAGAPGLSVTGIALAPTPGKPVAIAPSEGVRIEEGEKLVTYRAAVTGIVRELSQTRIDVGHSIEIGRGVDHVTGNIDAWGAVTVHGSVRARGNVTVDGTCESSFIQSDGDVLIAGGILGRTGVTEVKARGNVTARFVENAKVESGGDVTVKDSVLNSRVFAAGKIDVGGRGTVLSSHLASGRGIAASAYGSEARLPVELIVGSDPLAWRKLARMRRLLRFLRRATQKEVIGRAVRASPSARRTEDRQAKRRRSSEQLRHIVLHRERALVSTLFEGGGPTVVIRKAAFPRTTVRLGPHVYEVKTELHTGVLRIDVERGEITWLSADAVAAGKNAGKGRGGR